MSKYSKINIIYLLQKWMDSVPGQTFLNYAYSWGAAVVILGTLFKLTHLPGANVMLFIGMGTEVVVFFISAFDRPFDKSTIDMPLDNHIGDSLDENGNEIVPAVVAPAVVRGAAGSVAAGSAPAAANAPANGNASANGGVAVGGAPVIIGGGSVAPAVSETVSSSEGNGGIKGTIIIGGGAAAGGSAVTGGSVAGGSSVASGSASESTSEPISFGEKVIGAPAPAVTPETAERMEVVTTDYISHLEQLNEMLEKVAAQSARLATDSEEMENLNRTLTGISRVYEMQLKSASQQITTQDEINAQTKRMAEQIQELNAIYTRMIEAMTVNMPKVG